MNERCLPLMLLGALLAAPLHAQEQDLTPGQEREQIGNELEANRAQIEREVKALWEPGVRSDDQVDTETTVDNTPTEAGDRTPDVTADADRLRSYDTGGAVPRGTAQPDDIRRPVTTPTPVPDGAGRLAPEGMPSTGRPAGGVTVDPLPGGVPRIRDGNIAPNGNLPAGGNGTVEGNAPAGSRSGGAATGGPVGGAAGTGAN